ncbi:MAG: NYN domain-containing protein, partial [Acidimicrobiales bacterium]
VPRPGLAGPGRRRRAPPARRPVPLPPATFEESSEAAGHLVRTPGALLLVDGYNASFHRWPELGIDEQRDRLVAALAELSARSGIAVEVIFDGPEGEVLPPRAGTARRPVLVVFSPTGIEADRIIVERVAAVSPDRPVIVATSDRRVRDQVRAQGANLLTSPQLLELLGRRGGRLGRGE